MSHHAQTQSAGLRKHTLEFFRRVAALTRIKSDTNDFVQMRLGLFQGLQGFFFGQVPQKTHDE